MRRGRLILLWLPPLAFIGVHEAIPDLPTGDYRHDGYEMVRGIAVLGAGLYTGAVALVRIDREVKRRAEARERLTRGLCSACGYDLTGNVSGVCPECGTRRVGVG